jgi:hypothetical protein
MPQTRAPSNRRSASCSPTPGPGPRQSRQLSPILSLAEQQHAAIRGGRQGTPTVSAGPKPPKNQAGRPRMEGLHPWTGLLKSS